MTDTSISATSSSWLFVASSSEPRHLWDIAFAASVLRVQGVPQDRIAVFADHKTAAAELAPHQVVNVYALGELAPKAAALPPSESAVMVATGHGVHDGIGEAKCEISPSAAIAAIRAVPGVRFGVAVLGQCFGGVFNYTDADVKQGPPLAIVGATSLNTSISAKIHNPIATGISLPADWSANLFLYYFFEWLNAPTDVDGDGRVTLVDGYKYAGTRTSSLVSALKNMSFVHATFLAPKVQSLADAYMQEVQALQKLLANAPVPAGKLPAQIQSMQKAKLAFETEDRILAMKLSVLHSQQDAWILNARFARKISFWQ